MERLDVGAEVLLEEVVAQDHDDRLPVDEGLRPGQRVGDPPLPLLEGVAQPDPEIGSVPQEPLELRDVLAGHEGDVPDARGGEGADGVEDHRLVEHVEQVLVHDLRDGVEAGPESTGEHDAFHGITLT